MLFRIFLQLVTPFAYQRRDVLTLGFMALAILATWLGSARHILAFSSTLLFCSWLVASSAPKMGTPLHERALHVTMVSSWALGVAAILYLGRAAIRYEPNDSWSNQLLAFSERASTDPLSYLLAVIGIVLAAAIGGGARRVAHQAVSGNEGCWAALKNVVQKLAASVRNGRNPQGTDART